MRHRASAPDFSSAAEAAAAEEAASAVKTQTSVQPGIPVLDTSMPAGGQSVKCSQCGANLNADAKFCPQCGTRIEPPVPEAAEAPQSRVCPGCGAEVGAGEAAVLYILGVPLYRFIRKTGLMDKLLGRG